MSLKKVLFLFAFVTYTITYAQSKKDIIFTIDDNPAYAKEFIKVFNKNRDIVSEENKRTIEEYLDLYINYKLKLKEAYDLKYDTVSAYKNELATYREQLILPYLKDNKVTERLIREAYDRTKTEVNASHILVRADFSGDTIQAYNKITEARSKILSGVPFEEVAKEYSEDPSAQKNGGNLGYFSAFNMVYPFENAAYSTKLNEISMPFKTRFGYHIVKANDFKQSKGEIEVSHIFIKHNIEDTLYAKNRIDEIYALVQKTKNFELMAKMHSDDKNSAINEGRLPKFNEHRMIASFSDVAFSMKSPGDISEPFKTPYGWHIIKLINNFPVEDFDQMKSKLIKKIENSERAKAAGKSIVNKLIKDYNIIKNDDLINLFIKNDTVAISNELNSLLFSINGEKTKLKELISYKNGHKKNPQKDIFTSFFESRVLDYYKTNLEKTNEEFAFTLQEYKDGLLLFDILQDKVWKRAEKDTVALKKYFAENQKNYYWPKRADVIIASCTKKEKAEDVKAYLNENNDLNSIKEKVNEGPTIHVLFTRGILEEKHRKLPSNFEFKNIGVSPVIVNALDNSYTVVKINKILASQPMTFKEAKGRIINDFQNYLEEQWISDLKQKYSVKINKKTLKKLIKNNPN